MDVIEALGPLLYRFFLARFPRQVAEELVQEVFARLLAYPFDPAKGTAEALAWGIAMNVQREAARDRARFPPVPADFQEAATEAAHRFLALRQAIAKLEDAERTVMQLLLADLSLADIAAMLTMPEGTVKSHVHRAKQNLKSLLSRGSAR